MHDRSWYNDLFTLQTVILSVSCTGHFYWQGVHYVCPVQLLFRFQEPIEFEQFPEPATGFSSILLFLWNFWFHKSCFIDYLTFYIGAIVSGYLENVYQTCFRAFFSILRDGCFLINFSFQHPTQNSWIVVRHNIYGIFRQSYHPRERTWMDHGNRVVQ